MVAMPSLTDALTDDSKKEVVLRDCLDLIDAEVRDKRGLSGVALKAGYKVIKGFKPGFLQNVVRDLIPEFANALDPLYNEAIDEGAAVANHIEGNKSRAADALLAITDGKADRSTNKVVKGTYSKLRGTAKNHVEAAIPRLGKLIEKHAQ